LCCWCHQWRRQGCSSIRLLLHTLQLGQQVLLLLFCAA
jgi:hypothetical protein